MQLLLQQNFICIAVMIIQLTLNKLHDEYEICLIIFSTKRNTSSFSWHFVKCLGAWALETYSTSCLYAHSTMHNLRLKIWINYNGRDSLLVHPRNYSECYLIVCVTLFYSYSCDVFWWHVVWLAMAHDGFS